MKAILRIGEAAHLIGVSTKTIRRWDKAGKISCFRTVGNHRRIKLIEIQEEFYTCFVGNDQGLHLFASSNLLFVSVHEKRPWHK